MFILLIDPVKKLLFPPLLPIYKLALFWVVFKLSVKTDPAAIPFR